MDQKTALLKMFKSIGASVDTTTPGKWVISDKRVAKPDRRMLRLVPRSIVKSLNSAKGGSLIGVLANTIRTTAQTPGRRSWRVPTQSLGKFAEALGELNKRIGQCSVTMRAFPTSHKPIRFFLWPETNDNELRTIFQIISASDAGKLDRLKACDDCGRFFMARRDADRFCRASCRKHWYSKTPKGRENNRERQRRYRDYWEA